MVIEDFSILSYASMDKNPREKLLSREISQTITKPSIIIDKDGYVCAIYLSGIFGRKTQVDPPFL